MKYTINNKEYTEFDINKSCAELRYKNTNCAVETKGGIVFIDNSMVCKLREYNPCNNPQDTDAIIDKVFNCLLESVTCYHKDTAEWEEIRWNYIIQKHNCTKLVAACICFIEMNGGE